MRLKISMNAANETLLALVNQGYSTVERIRDDYRVKKGDGKYTDADLKLYKITGDKWASCVVDALDSIFPTDLERNVFLHPDHRLGAVAADSQSEYQYGSYVANLTDFVRGLDKLRLERLPTYTDLPLSTRLYVEDIDSFQKVRAVNRAAVANLLDTHGFLDKSEDFVQSALEDILAVPMHKKDWAGETNDLYTANVLLNGARVATAFALKGNGLRARSLEIADCGKNGDQLVRLMNSPAKLFIVQYVGNVSEAIVSDLDSKIRALRGTVSDACFCVIDGQDTARLLRGYGKL